jgi:hypothetical protein
MGMNVLKYKFSDLAFKIKAITHYVNSHNDYAENAEKKFKRFIPRIDLEKAIRAVKNKHHKYYGNSKYMPHQGKQECARRVARGY